MIPAESVGRPVAWFRGRLRSLLAQLSSGPAGRAWRRLLLTPRQPSPAPTGRQHAVDHDEAGATYLASIESLARLARSRRDAELLARVSRLGAAMAAALPDAQPRLSDEEATRRLTGALEAVVQLAVSRHDAELLGRLRRMHRALAEWLAGAEVTTNAGGVE